MVSFLYLTSATDFLRIFKPAQTLQQCAFYKMVIQVKAVLKAQRALPDFGALLFRIAVCSPDLNPIENVFNIVSAKLERDALRKQITDETFEQFSNRVEKTLCNIDPKLIDHTIESMNERIELIIKRRGHCLKY